MLIKYDSESNSILLFLLPLAIALYHPTEIVQGSPLLGFATVYLDATSKVPCKHITLNRRQASLQLDICKTEKFALHLYGCINNPLVKVKKNVLDV